MSKAVIIRDASLQSNAHKECLGMNPQPHDVTQLLVAWRDGDQVARDELMAVVYQELHRLAHHYMKRESAGHTLQTSALVNEAFLKLSTSGMYSGETGPTSLPSRPR
jgi:ECF sigma factor